MEVRSIPLSFRDWGAVTSRRPKSRSRLRS